MLDDKDKIIRKGYEMEESIYSFEESGRRKLEGQAATAAINQFLEKLEIKACRNADDAKGVIVDFILHHHKLISRYKELIGREKRLRNVFTALSICILIAIPALIFYASKLTGSPEVLPGQVTVLLTGLLGVHKSMSSWLDKRTIVGNFRKAESDLKSQLYEFEDRWRGKAEADGMMKVEFIEDLRKSINKAKEIQRTEQDQYFNSYTYPSIDLAGIMSGSATEAKALVKGNASPAVSEREAVRPKIDEHKTAVKRLNGEISALKALLGQKKNELDAASDASRPSFTAELTRLETRLREAEDKLVIEKGVLASLLD